MEAHEFSRKWQHSALKERSAAQEHFLDLCQLLGESSPAEADPKDEWYCFEKGPARRRARQAGRMSGSAGISLGSTRASAPIWMRPSPSFANMLRRLRIPRS